MDASIKSDPRTDNGVHDAENCGRSALTVVVARGLIWSTTSLKDGAAIAADLDILDRSEQR